MNLIPADSTENQQMTVRYGSDVLQLTIVWNSIGSHWFMDVFDVQLDEYIAQYVPLEVGTPICERLGREWIFMLTDLSSAALDPMQSSDLGSRCILMIGTIAEVKALALASIDT